MNRTSAAPNAEYAVSGRILAAPSWVFPASLHENCMFLAEKVQEVGVLCYAQADSLAYGQADLPLQLASLPLRWHVHLPLDLDWSKPVLAGHNCAAIMRKFAFLEARMAVLHPPKNFAAAKDITDKLALFAQSWQEHNLKPDALLLENVPEQNPAITARAAAAIGCSLCFDLSHYILYLRKNGVQGHTLPMPPEQFLAMTRIVHLCAPGVNSAEGHHLPLTELTEAEAALGARICAGFGQKTVFMLELFNWKDYVASLPILREWLALK